MIVVGIPVYHSLKTLPTCLDSLVNQTKKNFSIIIIQDGDNENYHPIIEEYEKRGLHIHLKNRKVNGGPSQARQDILDDVKCMNIEYVTFVDSDDILQPRAIEVLYDAIKSYNGDVSIGNIIRVGRSGRGETIFSNDMNYTWFGGKMYKVQYLIDINLNFPKELTWNEDSFFNLVAIGSTDKNVIINEDLYIQRENSDSLTHTQNALKKSPHQYIHAQAKAILEIIKNRKEINLDTFFNALKNIYYTIGKIFYYDLDNWSWAPQVEDLQNCTIVQEILKKEKRNFSNKMMFDGKEYEIPITFNEFINSFVKKRYSDGIYY